MTPEQWDRIQSLYHRLSSASEADHELALQQLCPDDDEVRKEVLELLSAPRTGHLETVLQQVAFDAASHRQQRIGPYRIEREIGRGGMGSVYLATRDDNQFERQVAVKFLHLGLDRPEYLQRFRQERQILADLEHPNIARLIEGGQSDEGFPYLVMEYVDGVPLLAYCDKHQLPRAARLHLLAGICDAVQYAHSQLVVHRDLKPSNILVTPQGLPKLLDFGIAKVLAGDGRQASPATRATGQMLTLDYASPEQIRGEPVSTVSDVYSLGVILYELLAGSRPFDMAEGASMAYCILHQDPPKPSVRARQAGLPAVPAELDNIAMKAMAREPERRYHSAMALADDLRRYLEGKPVLAHGDSTWYLVSKFVRRHRVQSAVACCFVLAVLALAIQLAIANNRLAAERDTAIRERSNARQVSNFLVDLFGNAEKQPNPGQEITAREILDLGAESLRAQSVTDPALRANLQMGVGSAYLRLGQWQRARLHLEEAMHLLRGLGEDAVDVRIETLTEYSNVLERLAELPAAEAAARELVTISRQHRPGHLPLALSALGNAVSHQGKHAEAEQVYREGLAIEDAESQNIIPLKANLSIALFRQGKFRESSELVQEVKDLIRTRWKDLPKAECYPLDTQANLECLRGNYREALRVFEQQRQVILRYGSEDDPMLSYAVCGEAEAHLGMRDIAAAEASVAHCRAWRSRDLKPDSHDAIALLHLEGMLELLHGRASEAEARFHQAHSMLRKTYGEAHASRLKALRLLAVSLAAQSRFTEAEQHFAEALNLWRQRGAREDPEYALLMLQAGTAARQAGRMQEAESRLRTALRVRQQLAFAPWLIHEAAVELAACLHDAAKPEEARQLVDSALRHYQEHPPEIRGQLEAAQSLLAAMRGSR